MKRFRFNLRTLLIAVALVAMFLGYAQWRRQSMLREAKELEAMGFTLLWQDTWAKQIWPVMPKKAKCEYYQVSENEWRFGSRIYHLDKVEAHYAQGCDRLNAVGVEEVRLDREGKPGNSGTSTLRGEESKDPIKNRGNG